ncbi:MAG: S-adenosylmethionine decarboxylase proenzyme [Firmicutes bacterium]|nr:S-adenosylmethionine decarboxylase proenzyme [Bacillota bacterium]HOB34150.1 adenosylmethionine decarboxylase [Bacillota bacterium]HPZ90648.1 adenosylmethionine decarboxylase [Bacillota bacterium]HQE02266.1 adenosylmethionine decarboxylase [Bacillota bacterium]
MAKSLGRHVLAEIYECDSEILNDIHQVEKIMVKAALEAGAEIREVAFHKFSPQGVSGVVVISESHLAIHTWPELGYAAVDVFTCGDSVDPWVSCNYIKQQFAAQRMEAKEVKRGVFSQDLTHKPAVNL